MGYFNAHGTSTKHTHAGNRGAANGVRRRDAAGEFDEIDDGPLVGRGGAIEAIICLLAIRDGVLPPSINYDTPDPECAVNLVANVAREARFAIAMSNSLGFGGHNASLLLKRYDGIE